MTADLPDIPLCSTTDLALGHTNRIGVAVARRREVAILEAVNETDWDEHAVVDVVETDTVSTADSGRSPVVDLLLPSFNTERYRRRAPPLNVYGGMPEGETVKVYRLTAPLLRQLASEDDTWRRRIDVPPAPG